MLKGYFTNSLTELESFHLSPGALSCQTIPAVKVDELGILIGELRQREARCWRGPWAGTTLEFLLSQISPLSSDGLPQRLYNFCCGRLRSCCTFILNNSAIGFRRGTKVNTISAMADSGTTFGFIGLSLRKWKVSGCRGELLSCQTIPAVAGNNDKINNTHGKADSEGLG